MRLPTAATPAATAFESKYRDDPDPWNFAGSGYERGRYAATLAALLRPRYATAFEPGCSVGELTAELALRCRRVIALDIAPTAVAAARRRCAAFAHVDLRCADVAAAIPLEPLDLVVFSEIGYYFSSNQLEVVAADIARQLQRGGEFVAVHWLGHSPDHALHGDTVHEVLGGVLPLEHRSGMRHAGFRIDTWVRE